MTMTPIHISQHAFRVTQFGIVTALVVFGAIHDVLFSAFGINFITRAMSIFDVGREDSLPNAFSIINLLVSTVLLFALYRYSKQHDTRMALYWLILCLVMFMIGFDESAGVHERLGKLQAYTGRLVPVAQSYSWIVYGAAFSLIVFVFFIPFLIRIERQTAALMFLSGAIFICGALGFETIAGWMLYEGFASNQDLSYTTMQIIEEGMEMYAIALFNCTLLNFFVRKNISFSVSTT